MAIVEGASRVLDWCKVGSKRVDLGTLYGCFCSIGIVM